MPPARTMLEPTAERPDVASPRSDPADVDVDAAVEVDADQDDPADAALSIDVAVGDDRSLVAEVDASGDSAEHAARAASWAFGLRPSDAWVVVLPASASAAFLAFSWAQADPMESAEGKLLGLLAGGLLAGATAARRLAGGRWLRLPGAGAALALLALWFLHQGPQRGAVVVAILALTWLLALGSSFVRVAMECDRFAAVIWWGSLFVGAGLLLRPDLLLPAPVRAHPWRLALEGGILPFVLSIPVALVATPALRRVLLRLDLPARPGLLRAAGAALVLLAFPVLLAASYPWQRPDPLSTTLGLLVPPRVAAVPIDRTPVVLGLDMPLSTIPLDPDLPGLASFAIDTALVHAADLTGHDVAEIRWRDEDGLVVARATLRAGVDSADWAAARPDVRAIDGFEAPPAWTHQVAAPGTFFAQRYRAVHALDPDATIRTVEIERSVDLPKETVLQVFRLELRR